MPNVETNQYGGKAYTFGFDDDDAPVISGFFARSAELTFESEVFEQAQSGEGHSVSIARSSPKSTISVTGYATSLAAIKALPETFTFESRLYIVRNVSEPRQKGRYVEVTIEAESFPGVTS